MRCLARFDAALAVFKVCTTLPVGQSISVPGEQPRQARGTQWRVDLAINPEELDCVFDALHFAATSVVPALLPRFVKHCTVDSEIHS